MERRTLARDSRSIQNVAIRDRRMLLGEREQRKTSLRHQRVFFPVGERLLSEKKSDHVYVTGHAPCAGSMSWNLPKKCLDDNM
jgi:hypothetical protein